MRTTDHFSVFKRFYQYKNDVILELRIPTCSLVLQNVKGTGSHIFLGVGLYIQVVAQRCISFLVTSTFKRFIPSFYHSNLRIPLHFLSFQLSLLFATKYEFKVKTVKKSLKSKEFKLNDISLFVYV